jgi:hypothetical protein
MKIVSIGSAFVFLILSCQRQDRKIVRAGFIDSLITNYSQPRLIRLNEQDSQFWKDRINPENPGLVNESRYAGQLATRFRLLGDIRDLKASDSILLRVDSVYNHKEASVFLAMVGHCLSEHRFRDAAVFLQKAREQGLKPYESCIAGFDVDFELGSYGEALENLNKIRSSNDYGYFFRKAKWEHYKGNLDSAITAMQSAYKWARMDTGLQQAALSNAADLYLHAGQLQTASDFYSKSIGLSGADIHSIMGLGWIALVHDKNDTLAEKIFHFAQTRTKLPDPLFRLEEAAQDRDDTIMEKKFAVEYVAKSSDSLYGNMFNKYLIDLYTGILRDPAKAVLLSEKEIEGRPTPQTYAWYVWSLFCNNKRGEAETIYEKYVSGKPLEGLELYWMGKFMKGLQKGYNAREFFKAAEKNKYDLSPAKIRDLERNLEE